MSVGMPQAADAPNDHSVSLILGPQQLGVVLRDSIAFDRETVRQSPDVVRICVSRAKRKLSAWRMTYYHLQGEGHQRAFSEIQRVRCLGVAMMYASSLQAWFQGFQQVATI